MTHIIIPIKDIEDRIKHLIGDKNKEAKYVWEDDVYLEEQYPEAFQLKKLLNGKQISLSEEDIEANHANIVVKCEALWMENYSDNERSSLIAGSALDGMIKGYKQALKDLL